jgi:hypothetical protein
MKDGKWLDPMDMFAFCKEHGFTAVPLMYVGPYTHDKIVELLPINKISSDVNEGVVVTPIKERHSRVMGRVKLKYISDEYLMLKGVTEFQ